MSVIRILVVEDEAIVAKDIQNRLTKMGYDVPALAHTGKDAVRLADEITPDLILMDIRLRGSMDGIMAAECIGDKMDVPVIFLTAYSDDSTLERAKATSPMAYLIKPFEDRDLHIAIEMALYRHYTSKMLVSSEKKYRGIFENANDVIVHLTSSGMIIDVNRKIEDVCGYSREELLGKNISELEFFPEKVMTHMIDILKDAVSGRVKGATSFEMIHRDGHPVFLEANSSRIDGENGEKNMLAIIRDVTRRVTLERQLQDRNELLDTQNEELRASEEELRKNIEELAEARFYSESLLRSFSDALLMIDFDGIVRDTNDVYLKLTGFTREEVVGQPMKIDAILNQEAREEAYKRFEEIKRGIPVGNVEMEVRDSCGEKLYLDVIANPVKDADGKPFMILAAMRDITERKQAEEALKASEMRFREMAELLPMSFCEIDLEGKVAFSNKYAFDLCGTDREDLLRGINVLETLIPEDRPRAIENMSRVFKGERFEGNEYTSLKKDGTIFPVMAHSSPIEKEGQIIGMRLVTVDLTDRKRAEQETARANTLEEVNRLKTILLATVSHELRTPLTSIKGLASTLIQPDVKWDHQTQKEFLYEIDKASDRLTHIVGDLIDMSQLEAGMMKLEKSPTTAPILLKQLQRQLIAITSRHNFRMDIPSSLPIIYCDEVRIGQVVTNIVSNAVAYSKPGTSILLEARKLGGNIQISITDQGIGIPSNKIDLIFDRFHRLEAGAALRRGGTGLGLSICKGIVENHGGRIMVKSQEGIGSCFSIFLPVSEEEDILSDSETDRVDERIVFPVNPERR